MQLKKLFELEIDQLVMLLRASGIRSLQIGDCAIHLTAQPPKENLSVPDLSDEKIKEELLPCGHNVWDANELGECLHGCVITKNEDTQ